uniref:hypothetical protein n=1 Tax=Agrobacterium tumefaciens TaxID=358 RepID=UPI00155DA550|nr:hypothetical protein [Agrobacterium tumefaciens]
MKGTGWPRWEIQWDLPAGVTSDEVLARHSVPHLLERLSSHRTPGHVQLGEGRTGVYRNLITDCPRRDGTAKSF